jgi:hypothetical protein
MPKNNIFNLEELFARDFGAASESVRMDNVATTISRILADTSAQMDEMLSDFSETSEDVSRMWGSFLDGEAVEVKDDLATPPSSTPKKGQQVQFPLRLIKRKTGFTNLWLRKATPADLARRVGDITYAFNQRVVDEVRFAMFNKTRADYVDWLTNGVTLTLVQPFINADSKAIPNAIGTGTAFTASSHQHYNGTAGAALAYGDIDALISNVAEHGLNGLQLRINEADVATLANLASTKFEPIRHTVIIGSQGETVVGDDPANWVLGNRLAGYWDGIPVWTKVYVPDNYYMCIATGAQEKPLVRRVDSALGSGAVVPNAQYGDSVLTAQDFMQAYGFGAYNRAACAFLKGDAQTTYANPSGLVR